MKGRPRALGCAPPGIGSGRKRRPNVGFRKIRPFEEQGLSRGHAKGIAEAIAVIQSSGMPSFAESAKGAPGDLERRLVEGDDFDARLEQQEIRLPAAFLAQARFRPPGPPPGPRRLASAARRLVRSPRRSATPPARRRRPRLSTLRATQRFELSSALDHGASIWASSSKRNHQTALISHNCSLAFRKSTP